MKDNIIVTCLVFLCGLIILRAYMALTTYLAFSKKERKKYQADCTLVDRWFFLSAHKIMKNKYSKYEKRTIPYASITKVYRTITITLHAEFALTLLFAALYFVFDSMYEAYTFFCTLYLISIILSIVVLVILEYICNRRYHINRYR